MQSQPVLVLAAMAAGVLFALVGVAYRLGQSKGIPTTAVFGVMTLVGAVAFASGVPSDAWRQLPVALVVMGVLGGLSQYFVMLLAAAMLRRGPLTTLWCAVNLGFLVNIVYGRVVLSEPILPLHVLAMLAGVACVFAAAMAQRPEAVTAGEPAAPSIHRHGSAAMYGLLFVALLMTNTIYPTGLKQLNARPLDCAFDIPTQRQIYLAVGFTMMAMLSIGHTLVRTGPRAWARWGLPIGALAAVGSVLGSTFMAIFTQLPAVVGFTTCSACSIMAAALFGTAMFGERRSRSWYATVAFALTAVALVALAGRGA